MEVEAERHGRTILRVSCNHAARAGVPVHQHPLQEAFFILEGQAEFALENGAGLAWKEVNPGDMVNIPPDAIHGFRNESDRDVKLLLTCEAGLGSYASMGTLQNRLQKIFETIAKACAELDAQLVLSLGSRDQSPGAAF